MRCFPASTTPCQQIAASKQRGLHHRLRLLQPVAISQMCDQRLPHIPGNTVPLALTKWVAKHWASLSPWCCKTGLLAHLTQWSAPHFVTVWPWTQSTRAVGSSPGERKKTNKKKDTTSLEVNVAFSIVCSYRLFGRCTKHWLVFLYWFLFTALQNRTDGI